MSTNNGKETCTDRSYMDFGHFIDPSEAFLIPGMVATGCTKSVEVLKYLSRNETGSVCSKKNQTCYKILSPWIGQLRNALKEVNHYWMDAGIPGNCETIPDLSGDTILTTSYFYLAFVEEQLEKIAMREDGQGLNNVVEHLNYCLDKLNNLSISR
ncbi:uncharacterized protein LOC110845115 [Folsomia candida]|nr:uncharacterized protein LOC110845115 [Folsomia candida]